MEKFYKELDEYIDSLDDKKNDYKILSYVVDSIGYIDEDIKKYICKKIDVFPFTLDGTIKYYPKLQKATVKNYIQVCTGRSCGFKGLKDKVEELKIKSGLTIEERTCLGNCGKGSVLSVGDKIYRYNSLEELEDIILKLK